MSKTQLMKVTARFFSKNRGKVTVVIHKRTLLWKRVNKEFSLFLKVYDEFAIMHQSRNAGYLFII